MNSCRIRETLSFSCNSDRHCSHSCFIPPPLPRPWEENLKTLILCYLEQTPIVCCMNVLLCHYLCEMATGYSIWYNGGSTGQLHNRNMAPKIKKFVLKSVRRANFWRKYEIFLPPKISLSETPISFEKSQISLSGSKKISHVWLRQVLLCCTNSFFNGISVYGNLKSLTNDVVNWCGQLMI